MSSRRSEHKWDFKKDEYKETSEEKEMHRYYESTRREDVLEHLPTETVANGWNEQDDQPVEQLEWIEEDDKGIPLNTANFDQLLRDRLAPNSNTAFSDFDLLPTKTALQTNPGARNNFHLFYIAMERCVERYIGKRSVPYMLTQIWENMKKEDKERFRTESTRLQYAFQRKFPELLIQSVNCGESTKDPVIIMTTLREMMPKNPSCALAYFRRVKTPEVAKNYPNFKKAQVLYRVEELYSNMTEGEKKENYQKYKEERVAYKKAMKNAPARKEAIRQLTEKMQEELKPFMLSCNRHVESFALSNPAFRTFTTPRDQFRYVLLSPAKQRKRPFYDAVRKITWESSQTVPVPVKKPVVTQFVNHVADSSEDDDMDFFKECFPEYPVDSLPKQPVNFVTEDLIPAKKMRYQDFEEPAIEQLAMTTQFSGNEFDDNELYWNDNVSYGMNGLETGYADFYPQEEQLNFETANFEQNLEIPIPGEVSVSNNLVIDHTTAFGRFALLECINLDQETLKSFTDETLSSFLQNKWEETSETRKADFELIGADEIGTTSQLLNGHLNFPFDRFCNHAIGKIGLDSLHPDEVRSLLENLWNLNTEENKSKFYMPDGLRTLNDFQFSAVSPNMPTVKEVLVGDKKKEKKSKKNQKQNSSSQVAPKVLDPAEISLF